MNKELRDNLEIATNYYAIREQAIMEWSAKDDYYEKKKEYYEKVLRSAKGKGKTVTGIILLCVGLFLTLISAIVSIGIALTASSDPMYKSDPLMFNISSIIAIAPFIVAACVLIIIGIRIISSRKARQTEAEQRAQRIWDEEVIPAQIELEKSVEETHTKIDPLDQAYQAFVEDLIPPSYRMFADTFALYDLVANGRADSIKEAVNLYEALKREEQKMQEFNKAMSMYESTMRDLIISQTITNMHLSQISDDIDNLRR